jgi:hypothetical protein
VYHFEIYDLFDDDDDDDDDDGEDDDNCSSLNRQLHYVTFIVAFCKLC